MDESDRSLIARQALQALESLHGAGVLQFLSQSDTATRRAVAALSEPVGSAGCERAPDSVASAASSSQSRLQPSCLKSATSRPRKSFLRGDARDFAR